MQYYNYIELLYQNKEQFVKKLMQLDKVWDTLLIFHYL